MAFFWMLEPVDITVTALLPVPLMPLLGILTSDRVAPNYMKVSEIFQKEHCQFLLTIKMEMYVYKFNKLILFSSAHFLQEVLMMFMGGLGVAVAVEHCNLHERIALRVLLTLGTNTKW